MFQCCGALEWISLQVTEIWNYILGLPFWHCQKDTVEFPHDRSVQCLVVPPDGSISDRQPCFLLQSFPLNVVDVLLSKERVFLRVILCTARFFVQHVFQTQMPNTDTNLFLTWQQFSTKIVSSSLVVSIFLLKSDSIDSTSSMDVELPTHYLNEKGVIHLRR